VVQADSDLVCDSFNNSVSPWLTEWNFPGATPPRIKRITADPEDLTERAKRDKTVFDMGFSPSLKYILSTYGEGWQPTPQQSPDRHSKEPANQPASREKTEFAEEDDDPDPVDLFVGQAQTQTENPFSKLLEPVKEHLEQASDLPSFRDDLLSLYRDLDTGPLTELLAQALLVADLAGRFDILAEADTGANFAASVEYGGLPFKEAITFFQEKVNLPTERWNDLTGEMHARAFTVAGAGRDDLLVDLHGAVESAITDGTTLQAFRKGFDETVEKHGWDYNGSRNWRTKVIFETNLRTAYQAGRYKQMIDPELIKARPWWQYKHSGSANPRQAHKGWSGLILPADDPWFDAHYPPNGFGCKCRIVTLADRDLRRLGKTGPDTAPTGSNDLDEGWDYNVGKAAWGRSASTTVADKKWQSITPGDWRSLNRPEQVPIDQVAVHRGASATSQEAMIAELEKLLGGKEKVFSVDANGFKIPAVVNAESMGEHLQPDRAPFLPYMLETIKNPYEVWLDFQRNTATGRVVLRTRLIKAVKDRKGKGVVMVLQAKKGVLDGWTMIPTSNLKYLQGQRQGILLAGR
jgi:hypothetical protein